MIGVQAQRVVNHFVHIHQNALRLMFAGEREQVGDDAGGAFGLVVDVAEVGAGIFVKVFAPQQQFSKTFDARHWIVQFVRDTSDKLAYRR